MEKCVIFCAAEFDGLLRPLEEQDFVIAADGGLAHTQALGIIPDAVLGDFDSLGYTPEGGHVFPVEKDDTDAMLAVRLGLEKGFREFWFYGAMDGPRLDHTVANFQALAFLRSHGAYGYLMGKSYIATVISKEILIFSEHTQGILSLFALGGPARTHLAGLQYPLDGALLPDVPLGVSNHFTGRQAVVEIRDGLVLALWDRTEGLPRRAEMQ